ncbi:MAG: radical SAM protein [Myxococcales bacterium]|nr:radical SAM protein [Myxococcales bacterium]
MRATVSWNIVGGCNYRCTYCVQKHAPGLGTPSDEELEGALTTLERLPGRWEFKISGGEPFLLKRLPEVASRLAAKGHLVSVLTNLSAPVRVLVDFIECAGASLRTFSCSLHREETTEDEFLEKALAVKAALAPLPKATFVVNSVVVPGTVDVVGESRRRFEALGVKFYPQLMRQDGKAVTYDAADEARLQEHFDDLVGPGQMNRGYKLTGKLCHAGSKYFIIHPRGDAFSCYPGKRFGDGHLGNVFRGTLALREGPAPCPYEVCPCTVPQNRGIIEGFGAGGEVAPREAD